MKFIVGRHGNTFGPNDKVVWVGSKTDLPLVQGGKDQAHAVGKALAQLSITPTRAISGPLLRTREFLEIVLSHLGTDIDIEIHPALTEIDYGAWEGLSNDEIAEKFGAEKMKSWSEDSVFQTDAGWSPLEEDIISSVQTLCHEIVASRTSDDDVILINTSNGILRYFLKLVPGAYDAYFEAKQMKVKTGNVCVFAWSPEGGFSIDQWNVRPQDLDALTR